MTRGASVRCCKAAAGAGKAAGRPQSAVKIGRTDQQQLVTMLGDSADKSRAAAASRNSGGARAGASSAFEGGIKADSMMLNSEFEKSASAAGIQVGELASLNELKMNDPSLNAYNVQIPQPEPKKDDEANEQMKMMIIQMLIQSILGPIFGAFGQAMAGALIPIGNT